MVVLADKHERYSIRCMTHPGFALAPGENRDRETNRENGTERNGSRYRLGRSRRFRGQSIGKERERERERGRKRADGEYVENSAVNEPIAL